jgi:hypothetical protein
MQLLDYIATQEEAIIPVEVTDIPNLFYLSAYPSDGARGA